VPAVDPNQGNQRFSTALLVVLLRSQKALKLSASLALAVAKKRPVTINSSGAGHAKKLIIAAFQKLL